MQEVVAFQNPLPSVLKSLFKSIKSFWILLDNELQYKVLLDWKNYRFDWSR